MALAVFMIVCIAGMGFLTVFLVELCRDSRRGRKSPVTRVETPLGPAFELDLDRLHSQSLGRATEQNTISIEQHARKNHPAKGIGTGTSGQSN